MKGKKKRSEVNIGGLVGHMEGGRIEKSHFSGKIKSTGRRKNINVGGLVGKGEDIEVKDSSSNATIETTELKVWSNSSFFILILGVIISTIYTIKTNLLWWQPLLIIVFGESLLLIIGAFILRYTGKLSEVSFFRLVSLALNRQFSIIKSIIKR